MIMETIYYNSPIGTLVIRGDETNITEILFLNTEKSGTQNDVPGAALAQCATLRQAVLQLDNYFSGKDLQFDLPITQHGTDFQTKVWTALTSIQPGKTLSYMQLSKNLGDVKAIRAVGTANGRNKIAIVVPCHRVIGAKGDLVGYAGDLWRKQWLLQHEAKFSNGVQTLF